ncbi:MAG: hypothetical protein ACI854_002539 [Arenicella sp.]|jgi:hypothetical protein
MRLLKVLFLLTIVLLVSTFGYAKYLNREQSLKLVSYLGERISICGTVYTKDSYEYKKLLSWGESNEDGWQEYRITAPVGTVIAGDSINFIVSENWVLVRSNQGTFSKTTNTKLLEFECG